MKALFLVALTGIAIATTGAVSAQAGTTSNSIMVHGYLGTAYGN